MSIDVKSTIPATVQAAPALRSVSHRGGLSVLPSRNSRYSLIILIFIGVMGYAQKVLGNDLLVIGFSVIVIYELQKRLDTGVPLMHIAAFLATSQWLLGPLWFYKSYQHLQEMGMFVAEREYFHLALPATACFVLGLFCFPSRYDQRELMAGVSNNHLFFIGSLLNLIAFAGDMAGRVLPGQLAFACFLVAQLRYVGCLYFLCSSHPWRVPIVALCMTPLLLSSAKSALFHDLLLWSGIVFCCWFSTCRRRFYTKLAILLMGVFIAFALQVIKTTYRDKVWQGQSASLLREEYEFWKNFSIQNSDEILSNVATRLNQGWIISAVMAHVPSEEAYARGDTIKEAVTAALLPRFLAQDKAKAGGREHFTRFTGLPINEITSMNVSLLGEGYANFGVEGGIIFVGIIGATMSLAFSSLVRLSTMRPTLILWVPMIFYQAVKAETDLTEVLNQVVKAGLVTVVLFAVMQRYFPERLSAPRALRGTKRDRRGNLLGRPKL